MVSRNIATAELIVALSLMKTLDCNKHQLSQTLFSSQQRSVDPSPILSGFVFVDGVVLKIKRRLNLPSACKSVEFVNVPSNTTSPLTKKVTFDLILDNLYNGRYGWTNGADYISYFPSSDDSSPYGTWLLGNKPGFDSGYAFLKPTYDTLVPVGIEQSDWHWLEEKNWEKRPAIKLICNDNSLNRDLPERESVSNHFYQVEYFVGPTLHSGFYTPAHMVSPENSVPRPGMKDSERKMYLSLSLPSLWSDSRRDRISTRTGESFKVLCKAGGATMISDSSGKSAIGHLIQDEHRALGSGWSLIFRRVLGTKSEETLSGWNSQIEILIDIDSKGNMNEFSLRPLSEAEELSYMIPMKKSLENSKKGDYLWVWYSVLPEKLKNSKFSGSIDMNIDGLDSGEITSLSPLSTQLIEQKVEEEIEILLECVASSDSKILFKYHLAERRATMRQSILSKETHYFTYNKKTTTDTRNENENKNESREPIMLDQLNSEIQTNAIFFIGSDVIGFIKDYLEYKEKASNGLSSCFLYHAAVTLPRSLVYAAEIICVLTGAKAVTLIQYSTPTDFQWKFPLVSELSHSIVRTKLLLGNDFDVEFRTFKHKSDESLVFYRTNRTYVANSLVPYLESQALHPLPYPDRDNPDQDSYKMQIYNAWWNGYVLGYPEMFINSYCEAFHNGLDIDKKRIEMKKAKNDAMLYMKNNNLSVALIGIGLEPSITDFAWESVISNL